MSRLAQRAAQGIVQCTEADLPELREFREQMYPYQSVDQLPAASFEWLSRTNPNTSPESTGIWICRRDGRIVGEQAELSFSLKVADEHLRAATAIELMVDPEWRLRGVGPALSEVQRKGVRVACALWMSDAAYRLYQRSGWIDLGEVPHRVLFVSPLGVLRNVATTKRRIATLAVLPVAAMMCAYVAVRARLRVRGTRLVETDAFDERADEIWSEASSSYAVIAHRDLQSLRWRFDECPYARHYRRFYLFRGARPVGYLVVRPGRSRRVPILKVVDYLAPPATVPVLLAHTVRLARRQSAALVEITTRDRLTSRRLTRLGFMPVEKVERWRGETTGVRFMVSVEDDDPIREIVTTPGAWFVTTADGDLDLAEFSQEPAASATGAGR
jgi:GNAT superfamily N-acetyltransferase